MVCRHYLNQWWNIVNLTIRNEVQWNINRNSDIFIQGNAFENIVCEMSAMLSRPHVLNGKSMAILHIVFSVELEQRLTKAYDVTIQRYHKLRTEIGQ